MCFLINFFYVLWLEIQTTIHHFFLACKSYLRILPEINLYFRGNPQFFQRRVSADTVSQAATILMMYLSLFLLGALVISRMEDLPILTCLFETASAIGTVGLTLGVTPQLNEVSRLILIALMYFGRVGGLTLIYAALSNGQGSNARLPQERITVG